MISLQEYIFETLSAEQIAELSEYIDDNNYNDCLNNLKNFLKKKKNNDYSSLCILIDDIINKLFKTKLKTESIIIERILSIFDEMLSANLKNKTINRYLNIIKDNTINKYGLELWMNITTDNRFKLMSEYNNDDKDVSLIDFLENKGLSKKYIKWGAKDPEHIFIDIFEDKMEILQKILNEEIYIDFNDFIKNGKSETNKNFIDLYCSDFKEEAIEIANITYVKANRASSTVGPFEILLKFLIKNATSGTKGDIYIKGENGGEVEVKNGFKNSGAHACGQSKFERIQVVYKEINNVFEKFGEKKSELLTGTDNINNPGYFQTTNTINKFVTLFNKHKDEEKFLEEFSNALCIGIGKQYGEDISFMHDNILNYISSDNFNPQKMGNVLCGVQLITYAKQEKFNYFCVGYLHTSNGSVSTDSKNGTYVILNEDDLKDLNKILDKIAFKNIEGTDSNLGSTGKLYIK